MHVPVVRQTLAHQIRESLISRITSGDIAAGTRLLLTELAGEYGTSLAPVREALRDLEAIRLVESSPRRGTFVRHFVEQTLRESYVVRAALEETATRLAILGATLPLEALREQVDAMRQAAVDNDRDAAGDASVAFHRAIVVAAGNELLLQSWESLQIEARTAATIIAADIELDGMADDHAEFLATLETGDLETCCAYARDHQWHFADLPHDAHGHARSDLAGTT